jgi:hypothetical protein
MQHQSLEDIWWDVFVWHIVVALLIWIKMFGAFNQIWYAIYWLCFYGDHRVYSNEIIWGLSLCKSYHCKVCKYKATFELILSAPPILKWHVCKSTVTKAKYHKRSLHCSLKKNYDMILCLDFQYSWLLWCLPSKRCHNNCTYLLWKPK